MANNKMLIDAAHPEETRVVMVRGNRVDEFDFESEHKNQLRGNIYLAKVTRVEPSLQAAFVDYGGNRHGFLAFSEIHPDYYQIPVADRQALIDAEAEDARAAAAAEAAEDDNGDDAEATEKPARKRRSRRRGKKTAEASEETSDAATDEDSAETAQTDEAVTAASEAEASATDDDAAETSKTSDDTADNSNEEVAESASEEDDDDDTVISAENDGDDVVSEPAAAEPEKKPRRRTSRKKKETSAKTEATASDSEDTSPAKADSDEPAAEEEPKKKPRRRTSRKKAEPKEASAEAETETTSSDAGAEDEAVADEGEKKPRKTRRRTSRKKEETSEEAVSEDETPIATDSDGEASENEAEASDEDGEAKEAKPRRSRTRSRSRRRKKQDSDDAPISDADGDENGSVEELGSEDGLEEVPVRRAPRRHYKIQEVIKRRQILLVQVVKEERGNKGAALTTYLSLAGRYSVLMPNTARGGGISRKITNSADRKRLKSIASDLAVPTGMGVILRTAGASRQQDEIQRDFEYLMRLWENVRTLTLESTAPCLVYEEGNLIKRSIRDLYDKDTGEILVAGEEGFKEAKDFMGMLMPSHAKNVKLYRDKIPMFARMGVEAQLDAMLQPQVTLKSGGYLIIDQTEALVAIDVNSGRSTRQHSVEETAAQTNLEAADEVARQLRLRDLAGLIVIDFIDMEDKRNVRAVERRLKDALKNDRARIQVGRISHFGLMEMSRQRIRASVLESTTQVCPTCEGLGHVRAPSSIVLAVLRAIEEQLNRNSRNNLIVKVSTPTALYLLNNKRDNLGDLESRFGVSITIETDDTLGTTPCVIERGEQSSRKPAVETAVQPDTINPQEQEEETVAAVENDAEEEQHGDGKKRRRRRRRRRGSSDEAQAETAEAGEASQEEQAGSEEKKADSAEPAEQQEAAADETVAEEEPVKKRTRRTRKKKTDDATSEENTADVKADDDTETAKAPEASEPTEEEAAPKKRRTRKKKVESEAATEETTAEKPAAEDGEETTPRRRTTRRKKSDDAEDVAELAVATASSDAPSSEPTDGDSKEPKKGGWWQRKFF